MVIFCLFYSFSMKQSYKYYLGGGKEEGRGGGRRMKAGNDRKENYPQNRGMSKTLPKPQGALGIKGKVW